MKILITGGGGFVGQALASALLTSDTTLSQLVLTDVIEPPVPSCSKGVKVIALKADLTSPLTVRDIFTADLDVVYLLHGIMSGAAEANLELGLKVNIDSMRLIMDTLRRVKPGIRVVFPSSLAVFGPSSNGAGPVTESTMPMPGSSYGAQKQTCEILLNDFSRRGLLDARIVRLPTIIVRPGKPSGAASSFCSGIIREPLKGEKSVLPVSRGLELWVCSTRTVVKNLIIAKEISSDKFALRSRIVNLPGKTVTVEQMLQALKKIGGEKAASLVEEESEPETARIVGDWPARFDVSWATKLGFVDDGPLERTLQEYIEDYGQ